MSSTPPSPLTAILDGLGAHFGSRRGASVALSFEGAAIEARATRAAAGLADWSFLPTIGLRGLGRTRFLHSQCTQDVQALKVGGGGYGFLLEAKGRNLGDLRFLVLEDEIRLAISPERLDDVEGHLRRFSALSEVEVQILSGDIGSLLVAGPRAERILRRCGASALPVQEGWWAAATLAGVPTVVEADRETGEAGFLLWAARELLPDIFSELLRVGEPEGLRVIGYDAVDILRAEAGRPWFGRDLDESALPEESGQVERAVSFSKGCYLGQEVVARQHFRGSPRKMLCGLMPEGAVSEGDGVWEGERQLGVVTTVVPSPTLERTIALAVLKGAAHAVGTDYRVRTADAEVPVRVAALPFVPLRGGGDSAPQE